MYGAEKKWFEKVAEPIRMGNFAGRITRRGRTALAVVGTAVSVKGISFMAREQLDTRELELKMILRERQLTVRVFVEKSEPVTVADQKMERHFGKFTAIAADDWDLVVRYVKGMPEPAPPQVAEPVHDEEFRLLPARVRAEITRRLVEIKRLTPPLHGAEPLLRFRSEGTSKTVDGRVKHRIVVESRSVASGERHTYTSHFTIWVGTGVVELHA